jgi:hypothetical protein
MTPSVGVVSSDDTLSLHRDELTLICKKFLKYEYDPNFYNISDSKQTNNESITQILNILFNNDENSLDIVESITNIINSDSFYDDRQSCGDFKTITEHFKTYYKALLEYSVKNIKFTQKEVNFAKMSNNEKIKTVNKIMRIVSIHCFLINMKQKKTFKEINILTVLKNCRLFVNNFLRYAMVFLDKAFDMCKEECVAIFHQLQQSIHFLQEICSTSNQYAIVKQTPVFLRSVEAYFLRVRQLLYVNNYDQAFSVVLFQNKMKAKKVKQPRKTKVQTAKKSGSKSIVVENNNNSVEDEDDEEEDDNNDSETVDESEEESD